jgi:CHAT domain-containing protein
VCATARPTERPDTTTAGLSFDEHLAAARSLFQRGQYREALEGARRAEAQVATSSAPDAQQKLHETLALIEIALGHRSEALRHARIAEAGAKQSGDVLLRITLARLMAQAGDLPRAGAILDEIASRTVTQEVGIKLLEARGDLLIRLGSPGRAMPELQRAVEGHREGYGPDHPSTASALQLLGDAQRLAAEFPAASRSYDEALRIRLAALGEKHPDVARTRNAKGVLDADLGDFAAADREFAAAQRALAEALGEDHPETSTARANRALARWGSTKGDSAAAEYAAAVEDLRRALGADHPDVGAALANAARMEFERGARERADALLAEALEAQLRALGPAHPAVAATRLARGRLLARAGDVPRAIAEIEGSVQGLEKAYGREHPGVARARTWLARTLVASGDSARAWREATEAARVVSLHARRSFGALSDRQRTALADDSAKVVGALLSVEGVPGKELFAALLPHRDTVLRSVAAASAAARGADPKAREVAAALAAARERYAAAAVGDTPELASEAAQLARDIDALEARAAASGASAADLPPEQVLAAACARLPKDAALVEYRAYDRSDRSNPGEARPAYAALVIRGGACEVTRVALGDATAIDAAADAFANAMREQRADARDARRTLSGALLAPLRHALEGTTRWLVVPDGPLWGVPLGALPDPEAPEERYLLERVTVGYLTSAYELAQSSADAESGLGGALLLGAPDFGGTSSGPTVLTAGGPCQLQPFEPLPATQSELDEIGSRVPQHKLVSGGEATKARLSQEVAARPRVMHLATHAYFAGLGGCSRAGSGWREGESAVAPNPLLLSGIALAGANAPARVDGEHRSGILTAYEVAGLDLRDTRLVVLSACETGAGLHQRGQEVQGLRFGFRAAGAHALLTSLWRSNDVATRKLMLAFYDGLAGAQGGADPFRGAEALRKAQLERIEDEKRLGIPKPVVWANFVFSGVL